VKENGKKQQSQAEVDEVDEFDSSILEIDLLHLEQEWANQPLLYFRFAKKLSVARLKLDRAKDNLKLQEATIQKDIRENPDKYSIPKTTEGAIEKWTLLQPEYQDAVEEYNEKKYRVDLLEAMCDAIETRKWALENEVKLFGSGYWAKPRADENTREEIEQEETRRLYSKARRQ
jgi:hypothetical protein